MSKTVLERSEVDAIKPRTVPCAHAHTPDQAHYLECKIILKPDRFHSLDGFRDFSKLVRHAAGELNVGFITSPAAERRPSLREVLFVDTPDFRLYNNGFILRRSIPYEDGFPSGDPEVVIKFRHPDERKAAGVDVRPTIACNYRINFKAEVLPACDQAGGYRILYSHNCAFGLSQFHEEHRAQMSTLSHVFPTLSALKKSDSENVELVNHAIFEEVLLEPGQLDFGSGTIATTRAALWRTRGEHTPLVGEYAYQCRFDGTDASHVRARERCGQFFVSLQHSAKDWISFGTTKTGMVYRLKGNAPQSHE